MISWCSYCQTYQGQIPPFDNYSATHGVCPECFAKGRDHLKNASNSARMIGEFYIRLRETAVLGSQNAGTSIAQVLRDRLDLGLRDMDLCVGMIQPLLYEIGELWKQGKVSVAEEHRFTAYAQEIIEALSNSKKTELHTEPNSPNTIDLLLVCAEGNIHNLGLQIIEMAMFDLGLVTRTLTKSLTNAEILSHLASSKARVLGVSISLPDQIHGVLQLAKDLNSAIDGPTTNIIVGGVALNEHAAIVAQAGNIIVAPSNLKQLNSLILEILARPIQRTG